MVISLVSAVILLPCCSYELLHKAVEAGKKYGKEILCGPIYSSDVFYDEAKNSAELRKLGVLAVEMEAASLYLNAARAGKNALCLCTISDHTLTGESMSAEQRQIGFREMMQIALGNRMKSLGDHEISQASYLSSSFFITNLRALT